MALKKYTIAEFRKATREAFNEVEAGGKVFITRHNTRYELIKADIQNGKVQFAQDATDTLKTPPVIPIVQPGYKNVGMKADGTIVPFPNNGDSGAQINTADDLASAFGPLPPEKNIASADALNKALEQPVEFEPDTPVSGLDIPSLRGQLTIARAELNRIDIDTQDPDEVERGTMLAARVADIEDELKKRGV